MRGRDTLHDAASRGNARDIELLLKHGRSVRERDACGWTPLMLAAREGHVDVMGELIRRGANVDEKCDSGATALTLAVRNGHLQVTAGLIRSGADVDAKDNQRRTALSHAAELDHREVGEQLLRNGASIDCRDAKRKTPLHYCAERAGREMLTALFRHGALTTVNSQTTSSSPSSDEGVVDLFVAAVVGDHQSSEALIAEGVSLDAKTSAGRTPLFYAAEFGHLEMVQFLIDNGASVTVKSSVSHPRRERDTPLTLAGRAGHMEVFRVLIEAGAPVNVRGGDGGEGETPLVSAARWGLTDAVQLLLAHKGCLRYEDFADDVECPLIPGTLETMKALCGTAFEFEPLCAYFVERLGDVCAQLQQRRDDDETVQVQPSSALVSFANIVFRFCRLLFRIENRRRPLSRFIALRGTSNKILYFHQELDHFAEMLRLTAIDTPWKVRWGEDLSLLQMRFEELLRPDEVLLDGFAGGSGMLQACTLLQYELQTRDQKLGPVARKRVEKVLERLLVPPTSDKQLFPMRSRRLRRVRAPIIPKWFISPEDVDVHSWNLERSEVAIGCYEGRWRNASVIVETTSLPPDKLDAVVSQWHRLSHPNVVCLFGACHIESPSFVVYEFVPGSKQLRDFLTMQLNRLSTWKCLYEAALGLQYLHNRGVVHGELRSESIIVGSDLVVRLLWIRQQPFWCSNTSQQSSLSWKAPEVVRDELSTCTASDVFAFGMYIWEVLTLQLPWNDAGRLKSERKMQRKEGVPDRPSSLSDAQRHLISKMCAFDPEERASIDYVVSQLKKLVAESETSIGGGEKQSAQSGANEGIEEHLFAELGRTIPDTLLFLQTRCAEQPVDPWMSNRICPALQYISTLLQRQKKAPADVEVVQFCTALSRFQRFLRTTISEKSILQLARSRKVDESHQVMYAELDRLLDMLGVSETDSIRAWRRDSGKVLRSKTGCLAGSASASVLQRANDNSTGSVQLKYAESDSLIHTPWTQAGLSESQTRPAWYLPLREVKFSESDQIGQGAFGAVYKGSWLDTPVVVKFMGYEEDPDTISTDLLLHEVRVWHRLTHPHVLKFYGACHVDKRYFVCEYAPNGDLKRFLKTQGSGLVTWQKLHEVAIGLKYLHGQDVVHNDLKCDNILIGADGKAKLIDFGLSCLVNEAEIEIEAKNMGAVHWKSPEYLEGKRPSFESDVYSFAMCILEAVTGDVPWGSNMLPASVRYQVLRKQRIPNLPDPMNEKQRNLVQLMTKRDPSQRVKMSFVVDKLSEIAQDEKLCSAAP